MTKKLCTYLLIIAIAILTGCATTYYNAMEKVGVHKRDILVDRIRDARDSQAQAQEQFKSALEQFASVVALKDTDLKKAYESLNNEYEDCEKVAQDVSSRIEKVESVADALFKEWENELDMYTSRDLQSSSRKKLDTTRSRYQKMLFSMKQAERGIKPVLGTFYDNVLFLKHNLNAQAITSLKVEFSALRGKIGGLINRINDSIESSNRFIAEMEQ